MGVKIRIDQAGKPPGVAGMAREDLDVGVAVTLTAVTTGPILGYLWRIVSKPVDVMAGVRSAAALTTPTASATMCSPIDLPQTYLVECLVDAGFGLGARSSEDRVRITFYAGPALAVAADQLPRREPAFQETIEHNVPDAIDPTGNADGWAREWARWFAVIKRVGTGGGGGNGFAGGVVQLTGGGATLLKGENIASVTRLSTGTVRVVFTSAAADANYSVVPGPVGVTGGSLTTTSKLAGQFDIERADLGGVLVDANFDFSVGLGT